MSNKPSKTIPQDILEVGERFEHWRKTRPKRMPIPDELWQAAISLTDKYTLAQIAGHLRLNLTKLRNRVLNVANPSSSEQETVISSATQFVQLPSIPLLHIPPIPVASPAESVVEMTDAAGTTLIIRLAAGQPLDIVGLAHAFLGRGT